MNEANDEPNAQQSLCWNCKHGMCIRETHQEHLLNFGMPGMPPRQDDDPFEMPFNQEDGDALGHIVEHEHIRSVCFWRPDTIKDAPPILIGFIKECSQFEKK